MDHRYNKLLVLVEEGSYSAAARKLRISQPAMTIAIATLEKSIGKKLFVQKKPIVKLSTDGEIVYNSAKKINAEIIHMKQALDKSDFTKPIQVGFIDSIAHLLYNSTKNNIILSDFEAMVDSSRKIINDVANNQIKFGFITGQTGSLTGGIKIKEINTEPFVFVKKPSMVNKLNENIIDDWLAFNRASTSYHLFSKQFKQNGIKVKAIFYSTSMELLKDMAMSGVGTALLPRHFVDKELKKGELKLVSNLVFYRPIWVVSKELPTGPILNNLVNSVNIELSK